jgi:hypothetical protein
VADFGCAQFTGAAYFGGAQVASAAEPDSVWPPCWTPRPAKPDHGEGPAFRYLTKVEDGNPSDTCSGAQFGATEALAALACPGSAEVTVVVRPGRAARKPAAATVSGNTLYLRSLSSYSAPNGTLRGAKSAIRLRVAAEAATPQL